MCGFPQVLMVKIMCCNMFLDYRDGIIHILMTIPLICVENFLKIVEK